MTAPNDTQAPERLDLYFAHGRPMMKPAKNGRYVRSADYDALTSLAAAREAAAALEMREAAEREFPGPAYGGELVRRRISALPLPDTQAALDRLIAEARREAVEAEREACAKVAIAKYADGGCGREEPMEIAAAIRARGSKEGRDG